MKRSIGIFVLFLALLGNSCTNSEDKEFSAEEVQEESARLKAFFEREFQVELERSPMLQTQLGIKEDYGEWDDFSTEQYAEELEIAKSRLAFLQDSIEEKALNETSFLSFRLYKQEVEHEIENYRFRFYNYPINQMYGTHTQLPAFLINMHLITNKSEAEAYISRLKGIPNVIEDVIEGIKLREINKIVPPSFVFDLSIEASKNILKGRPFEKSTEPNALLNDFTEKVEQLNLSEEEKAILLQEAEQALVDYVRPAYLSLVRTLEDQRQRSTEDHGVWKFPSGNEFYASALKESTTTDLSAEEIHQFGLDEVARIHKEMEKIKEKLGFEGSLQDFFAFMRSDEQFYYSNDSIGKTAYLTEATEIIETMKTNLKELFLIVPQADIKVKAVEPFREQSAGKAFYNPPALDGSRPGIYYTNLYDMTAMPKYQMEALAYHEGIPGHHMQIALAQEIENIPMFRKINFYTAYVEGWGLYAELVPKEIGFYKDPYSDFGRLAMELWRSIRLVVDTGIHSKKWTREQGIEYYMENSPNAESDAIKMVERHIVMPGQATAYKIGMNKILVLRQFAKDELGEGFDLRKFHEVILGNGALPLNILEEVVNDWIKSQKTENE